MAKINQEMMQEILNNVGGANNINRCSNCMTRLRLKLADSNLLNKPQLQKIDGVLGVIESNEELQIVLGPGKAKTAQELMSNMLANLKKPNDTKSLEDIAKENKGALKNKQKSSIQGFFATFATIFTPLIPGFIAAGLLLGFSTLIKQALIVGNENPSEILIHIVAYTALFGKGLFAFLSIIIGYNAQKAFGGSGVNGAIIASLFVLSYDPALTGKVYSGMTDFFGLAIDPRGNIVGVLIACILGAKVENYIRKYIPDSLDMILTSTITLLVMGAFVFTIIMPLGSLLFDAMSFLFINLNSNPFGSAVLAGLFLIAVMFGVHQGFVPIYFALVETQGFNSLFPILAMAGAGQVGASLAIYFKAKAETVTRKQIKGAIIPGILGIGEPLIYGVTLPRVKPFITACIGGACGGFFLGLIAYIGYPIGLNTVFGPSGVVSIPLMTSNQGIFFAILIYVLALLIAYIAGFILTLLFGTKNINLD